MDARDSSYSDSPLDDSTKSIDRSDEFGINVRHQLQIDMETRIYIIRERIKKWIEFELHRKKNSLHRRCIDILLFIHDPRSWTRIVRIRCSSFNFVRIFDLDNR